MMKLFQVVRLGFLLSTLFTIQICIASDLIVMELGRLDSRVKSIKVEFKGDVKWSFQDESKVLLDIPSIQQPKDIYSFAIPIALERYNLRIGSPFLEVTINGLKYTLNRPKLKRTMEGGRVTRFFDSERETLASLTYYEAKLTSSRGEPSGTNDSVDVLGRKCTVNFSREKGKVTAVGTGVEVIKAQILERQYAVFRSDSRGKVMLSGPDGQLIGLYASNRSMSNYDSRVGELIKEKEYNVPCVFPEEVPDLLKSVSGTAKIGGETVKINYDESSASFLVPISIDIKEISVKSDDSRLGVLQPKFSAEAGPSKFLCKLLWPDYQISWGSESLVTGGLDPTSGTMNVVDGVLSDSEGGKLVDSLREWIFNRKTEVRVKFSDSRISRLAPRIEGNIIDVAADRINWYRARFRVRSPFPAEFPELIPNGWTVSGASNLASLRLDAEGRIEKVKLRRLLKRARTIVLTPPKDTLDCLLEPAELEIDMAGFDVDLDYDSDVVTPTKRMANLNTSLFRGYAPAVDVSLKDGSVIELYGEVDRRGATQDTIILRRPTGGIEQFAGEKGIEVALADIVSITPVGLSSATVTELSSRNASLLVEALTGSSSGELVELWRAFFSSSGMGIDVYSDASGVIRFPARGSAGGIRVLQPHVLSSRYWTHFGNIREGTMWWNGGQWETAKSSHVHARQQPPSKVYFLVSACGLKSGVGVSSSPAPTARPRRNSGDAVSPFLKSSRDPLAGIIGSSPDESAPSSRPVDRQPERSNPMGEPVRAPVSGISVKSLQAFLGRAAGSMLEFCNRLGVKSFDVDVIFVEDGRLKVDKLTTSSTSDRNSAMKRLLEDVPGGLTMVSRRFTDSKSVSHGAPRLAQVYEQNAPDLEPGALLVLIVPEGEELVVSGIESDRRALRLISVTGFLSVSQGSMGNIFERIRTNR